MTDRKRLVSSIHVQIGKLPAERLILLLEMAESLGRQVKSKVKPDSDIVTKSFNEDFTGRLVLFHAMHDAPLTKKTFEYFFAGSCCASGRSVQVSDNQVLAGEDVIVDGVPYSLKTEASKAIKKEDLHISKLMEARWIRDCEDGDDFLKGVREKIVVHLSHYKRILSLRAFKTPVSIRYELVEIPRDVLEMVGALDANDFSERTDNGSSSAFVCLKDGSRVFTLCLDGSVEKVTIRNLKKSVCIVHAEWVIDVESSDSDE